jgi:ATP-binding cassette subfamily F protein uup
MSLDGSGRVTETVGGYDDWQSQNQPSAKPEPKPRKATVSEVQTETTSKKLSYKEQRALESQKKELAELPRRIEKLEADIHALTVEMAAPPFYQQDNTEITRVVNQLKEMQDELTQAYHRWEELEKLGI